LRLSHHKRGQTNERKAEAFQALLQRGIDTVGLSCRADLVAGQRNGECRKVSGDIEPAQSGQAATEVGIMSIKQGLWEAGLVSFFAADGVVAKLMADRGMDWNDVVAKCDLARTTLVTLSSHRQRVTSRYIQEMSAALGLSGLEFRDLLLGEHCRIPMWRLRDEHYNLISGGMFCAGGCNIELPDGCPYTCIPSEGSYNMCLLKGCECRCPTNEARKADFLRWVRERLGYNDRWAAEHEAILTAKGWGQWA